MDQPSVRFFGYSNGGTFSLVICSGRHCCTTGFLDTKDNNWEQGQVDWFVGRQAGSCDQFRIDTSQEVMVRLRHKGSDAGRLDWIMIHPWHQNLVYSCEIGVRLDHRSYHDTECVLFNSSDVNNNSSSGFECNGREEFCWLRFDQLLFPGTHNSGTGQKKGMARCASKNQDMDIIEQLEFGIRFFDLDVIYSTSLLGCSGLETGHGSHPELGLYQCYGRMEELLQDLLGWLDKHWSEVVVLHFGNIALEDKTVPRLKDTIKKVFSNSSGVKINGNFKKTGEWPMMGDAVENNERVFIFIRDEIGNIREDELEFVKEIKRKPLDDKNMTKTSTEIFMTSSYKAERVGDDCRYILETSNTACMSDMYRQTDFLKLSLFSRFGKGGTIGTECIHEMAKKCNYWISEAIENCNFQRFRPNFVVVDYPNYQGLADKNVVQIAFEVNMERANMVRHKMDEDDNDDEVG